MYTYSGAYLSTYKYVVVDYNLKHAKSVIKNGTITFTRKKIRVLHVVGFSLLRNLITFEVLRQTMTLSNPIGVYYYGKVMLFTTRMSINCSKLCSTSYKTLLC